MSALRMRSVPVEESQARYFPSINLETTPAE